jgi:hypothetical protein
MLAARLLSLWAALLLVASAACNRSSCGTPHCKGEKIELCNISEGQDPVLSVESCPEGNTCFTLDGIGGCFRVPLTVCEPDQDAAVPYGTKCEGEVAISCATVHAEYGSTAWEVARNCATTGASCVTGGNCEVRSDASADRRGSPSN